MCVYKRLHPIVAATSLVFEAPQGVASLPSGGLRLEGIQGEGGYREEGKGRVRGG